MLSDAAIFLFDRALLSRRFFLSLSLSVDKSKIPCYTVLQLIGGLVNAFTKLDKMPEDRSVFYPAFLYNREFLEEMI